jgi:ferritin-like metal-binding protein YciE
MKLENLEDLFVDELKDLYSAETQLIKALPKLAKASASAELRAAFAEHLELTQQHAARIEDICAELEASPRGKKCKGMEGLIEEGKEMIEQKRERSESNVTDAGIIGAAQRVEHYEIASYGTARAHAQQLGHNRAAAMLQQTLDEERQADEKLSELAEGMINQRANMVSAAVVNR